MLPGQLALWQVGKVVCVYSSQRAVASRPVGTVAGGQSGRPRLLWLVNLRSNLLDRFASVGIVLSGLLHGKVLVQILLRACRCGSIRVTSCFLGPNPGSVRSGCCMAVLLYAVGPMLEGLPSGYPDCKFQSHPTVPPGRLIGMLIS
jgi:hypothetical protein